ncbi:MAG TPA: DNA-binding protein [Elusimicrobiota bacterium]|nr:DNA-binding protein [Elusimicrobiota bacterium]
MKFSQAKQGRTFIIRLEDGDIIHREIEKFAQTHSVRAGFLVVLGGADTDSTLVVGPKAGRSKPIVPMKHLLDNVHEVTGTGTLFPNEKGEPVLHMHVACGRKKATVTGCVREGVRVWHVLEVILVELLDTSAVRAFEPDSGFELLRP